MKDFRAVAKLNQEILGFESFFSKICPRTYPRILNIEICDDFFADFALKEEGYLKG